MDRSASTDAPPAIVISPEVGDALARDGAVVALESAVITHGLPRAPLPPLLRDVTDSGWRHDRPAHLELARAMQRQVRAAGAVPALIGLVDGRLHIGMTDEALDQLAGAASPVKCAASNLAWHLGAITAPPASRAFGGTTVSATLAACRLALPRPIRVFATGGIGGVHREWTRHPDISADLRELAGTECIVVCAGAKSILDLPATLEVLEALSVPVIGVGTSVLPRFHDPGDERLPLAMHLPASRTGDCATADRIADLAQTHWRLLGRRGGILVVQPVPAHAALAPAETDRAVALAARDVDAAGVTGGDRTPALLAAMNRLTDDLALRANIALLLANAALAARIAVAAAACGATRTGILHAS